MSQMQSSREAILSDIRGALGARTKDPDQGWQSLPRNYKRVGTLPASERLLLLEARLADYGAVVHHSSEAEIAASVAKILTERGKKRLAIPAGLPAAWLPQGFEFVEADRLAATDLNQLDGTVSAATLAIAETGTIMLQTLPAQGPRKLSLVPDFHLSIVFTRDVVETVPEAFERIRETASLPTTFISGPSATADIEMTRIKGVHGPRALDVLLVD
jgi:L-lactate dehydrogenase complex protein LldG